MRLEMSGMRRLQRRTRMGTEVWTIAAGYKTLWDPVITAEQAESEGWDGLVATDSQSRRGDPYIALALAAKSSTRLLLATGVTNPVTRHPVITANCAATVQEISGGRMVLGIGRGDSALAYSGLRQRLLGASRTTCARCRATSEVTIFPIRRLHRPAQCFVRSIRSA